MLPNRKIITSKGLNPLTFAKEISLEFFDLFLMILFLFPPKASFYSLLNHGNTRKTSRDYSFSLY